MVSVDVVFIEDPACSWCWAFQPVATAFAFEYRKAIASGRLRVRQIMGGLRDRCVDDIDFIMYQWRKAHAVSGMPFVEGIWRRHVLRTTFLACRSVKAAGLVHPGAAQRLLRRLREAFYVEETPIDDEETVIRLADELGLCERFGFNGQTLREYLAGGRVDALFERDRREAEGVGFGFPTVIVRNLHHEAPCILNGTVPYAELVAALSGAGVGAAERQRFRDVDDDWRALFDVHPRLTEAEIREVTGLDGTQAGERLATLGVTRRGEFFCWPDCHREAATATVAALDDSGPALRVAPAMDAPLAPRAAPAATATTAHAPGEEAPCTRPSARARPEKPKKSAGQTAAAKQRPARVATQPASSARMPPAEAFELRLRNAPPSSRSSPPSSPSSR